MNKREFTSALRDRLRKERVSREEIEDALTYYSEAIDDRMEDGMSEEDAVAALGEIEQAVASVCADRPVVRKAISRVCVSRTAIAVAIVLLVLGAIAWIPLVLALGVLAVAVYLAIWALIASLWLADASLVLMGIVGVPFLVHATTSGAALSGVLQMGCAFVMGGLGVLLVPVMSLATGCLIRASLAFARWVGHFFMKVPASGRAASESCVHSWGMARGTWRGFVVVGGVIIGVGLAAVAVAWVSSGFDLGSLPKVPPMHTPLGDVRFDGLALLS